MRYFGSFFSSPSTFLSALSASTLLCCATATNVCCKPEPSTRHGVHQHATHQELQEQNVKLLEQVVRATEEQENHPDPNYLRGALGPLDGWLAALPPAPDFEPDAEFNTTTSFMPSPLMSPDFNSSGVGLRFALYSGLSSMRNPTRPQSKTTAP